MFSLTSLLYLRNAILHRSDPTMNPCIINVLKLQTSCVFNSGLIYFCCLCHSRLSFRFYIDVLHTRMFMKLYAANSHIIISENLRVNFSALHRDLSVCTHKYLLKQVNCVVIKHENSTG